MRRGSSGQGQNSGQQSGVGRGQMTQGRLYTVPDVEQPVVPDTPESLVVCGMILIYHSWASVLIDSGASHSFLAFSLAYALGLDMKVFDPPLIVESPIGGHIPLSYIYRQCEMTIEDQRFTFNFIILDMTGFDLILGMD